MGQEDSWEGDDKTSKDLVCLNCHFAISEILLVANQTIDTSY
jgi:hypothetical protein